MLAILQQLTGINAVIFYSTSIFASGPDKVDTDKAKIGTMLIGIFNCFSSVVGAYMLMKFGRRSLLYNGMIGMAISLSMLAFMNEQHAMRVVLS